VISDLIERLLHLNDSMVDFPRPDLDLSVWNKTDSPISDGVPGAYTLKPDVKKKILDTLNKYPDTKLIDGAAHDKDGNEEIHIIGSICTNQYVDDSDIDVHIVVSQESKSFNDEDFQDAVNGWFKEEPNKQFVGKHPIEVYLQFNPNQELLADGVYHLMTGGWIKGPKVVPNGYNPYEDFSHVFDDVRSTVQGVDLMLGELKRDVIDYETIKTAITRLPKKGRGDLKAALEAKLEEIEQDIQCLYKKRKGLAKSRELASQPKTPEEALKSAKLTKEWRDKNAAFKFVARYQYMRVIKELESLLDDEDGELTGSDVKKVKKIVGGLKESVLPGDQQKLFDYYGKKKAVYKHPTYMFFLLSNGDFVDVGAAGFSHPIAGQLAGVDIGTAIASGAIRGTLKKIGVSTHLSVQIDASYVVSGIQEEQVIRAIKDSWEEVDDIIIEFTTLTDEKESDRKSGYVWTKDKTVASYVVSTNDVMNQDAIRRVLLGKGKETSYKV
jgi:predicted nucleotidyltransferase